MGDQLAEHLYMTNNAPELHEALDHFERLQNRYTTEDAMVIDKQNISQQGKFIVANYIRGLALDTTRKGGFKAVLEKQGK